MITKQEHHPAPLDWLRTARRGANFFVSLAGVMLLASCGEKSATTEPATPPVAPVVTNAPAAAAPGNAQFQKLLGRWLRPDGGYILEIKSIAASGSAEAGYFNPNPIRVAKAEVKDSAGTVRLFVELRDTGYPGCTYNLVFDPTTESLVGTYFQAALQQEFSVGFSREK